eukprot:2300676-Amphidinium_carterae.1
MKQQYKRYLLLLKWTNNIRMLERQSGECRIQNELEDVSYQKDYSKPLHFSLDHAQCWYVNPPVRSPTLFPPQPDYDKNLHVAGAALCPPPPDSARSYGLSKGRLIGICTANLAFMAKRDAAGNKPVVVDFGSMTAGAYLLERLGSSLVKLGYNVCLQVPHTVI